MNDSDAAKSRGPVELDVLKEVERRLNEWAATECRDGRAALEGVQELARLGYRIVPPGSPPGPPQEAGAEAAAERLLETLNAAAGSQQELGELLRIWRSRVEKPAGWDQPEPYRRLGRRLLKLGAAPVAHEVARCALSYCSRSEDGSEACPWERDVGLRQILGLALARTANADAAQRVLLELRDSGNADEETLGILARTFKDQAMAPGCEGRAELLERSLEAYEQAYRRTGGFWTGINVATLARLASVDHPQREALETRSRAVAAAVREQCLAALETAQQRREDLYWLRATLGEAALNLGDLAEAAAHYRAAYEAAARRFGDLNSTRRHARWLLDSLGAEAGLLDQWLPLPKVVVFAGHMIDQAGRTPPRFPESAANRVKAAIREWLVDNHALVGYSSAACGADILFQEALHAVGGEAHIVLPYDADAFELDSVRLHPDSEWPERFRDALRGAASVVTASPQKMEAGGVSYDYANLMLHGLATVRARELESELAALCVWDGRQGDGPGGTASVVARWHQLGVPVHRVDLANAGEAPPSPLRVIRHTSRPAASDGSPREGGGEEGAGDTHIMAMLFGDAVNFSKLTDDQVPRFVQQFLGPIAALLKGRYRAANVVRNTWGDGLYLVFHKVGDAGRCALDICEFVNEHVRQGTWAELGLPRELNARLALHAGPVFRCKDPVTGQMNYTGTHVSRAARLEPKTPSGEVYASEAFAALVALEGVKDFSCHYVKQLEWAKHYGSFPTYVLKRTQGPET